MAGEIGHVSIDLNGRKTAEGRGGLETYVGNRRLVGQAVKALRHGKKSLMTGLVKGKLAEITPRVIAGAAAAGDQTALKIMDRAADCLATAFATVTYLLQPEAIIVGGGVAASGRVLFAPLRRHLAERLNGYFAERIKIIPATLGARAGLIGCAALVFQNQTTVNRELFRQKRTRRGGELTKS
jgi:glucokinase